MLKKGITLDVDLVTRVQGIATGGLDPDFATLESGQAVDRFASGKVDVRRQLTRRNPRRRRRNRLRSGER